jgi:hypothetical protein
MPLPVAVPPQPLMLSVPYPLAGVAVQVVVLPAVTGEGQDRVPCAPGLALTVNSRGAAQFADVPVFWPAHVQLNCVAPVVTAGVLLSWQRLLLGALSTGVFAALPQAPLTICPNVALTVQFAVIAPVVKLFVPLPVAVPPQPLMLSVI